MNVGETRKVGSDGFVRLDTVGGSDEHICQVARHTSGAAGVKLPPDNRALIRYLFRHGHTTPIEFGEATFFLRIQMDALRQMIRHRTACLAGDTVLHFDLPGGVARRGNQLYPLTIKAVFDKFQPTANATEPGRQGDEFDRRGRVQTMLLRSLNEETGEVRHTQIVDVWETGDKAVWAVQFEDRVIKASADHLFLTDRGWRKLNEIAELSAEDSTSRVRAGFRLAHIGPGRDTGVQPSFNPIDPDTESWEPVVGWGAYYQVSSQGRVRRIVGGRGSRPLGRCKTLTVADGRAVVSLNRPGTQTVKLVHQLVMEAFRGPCPDGHEVCHENGNSLDNRVENLRYGTPESNAADQARDGATTRLARSYVEPTIRYAGREMTYDLEVAGPWHNFSANGFVVHNSVNEYSTRYRPAIDEAFTLGPDEWRLQSKANRQGSAGGVVDRWPDGYRTELIKDYTPAGGAAQESRWVIDPDDSPIAPAAQTPGEYLTARQGELQAHAREVYDERLKFGVAFEVARKDLPLATYTELYWKCDLNNIFRFLSLRTHSHAQAEIRAYADAMCDLLKPHFPFCFEAFDDFDMRRGGLLLSRLEVDMIRGMLGEMLASPAYPAALADRATAREQAELAARHEPAQWAEFEQWQKDQGRKTVRVGERDEALVKLRRLGLLPEA